MTEELVPWNPYEEGPFSHNGRNRTNSEIEQMFSLRSVHGSLQKIVKELDQDTGRISELVVDAPTQQVSSQSLASHPQSYKYQPMEASRPSIQRQSETPEVSHRSDSAVPSWEQFALQIQQRHTFSDLASVERSLQPVRSRPTEDSPDMNTASSAFVFRQFESISRRDIIVDELDSRHAMVLLFAQATRTMLAQERFVENRKLRERISLLEEREMENQMTSTEGIKEIETQSRYQIQSLQSELSKQVREEISKLMMMTVNTNTQGSLKWLVMHEERRRHEIEMESVGWISKAIGEHLSQLQSFALQFQLYRARAQNIAGSHHKDAYENLIDEIDVETVSETEYIATKPTPAYDASSGNSLAARTTKADAAAQKKSQGPTLSAVPDSKSYIDSVINRNKSLPDSTKKAPTTPRNTTKSIPSASTPRTINVPPSPTESKVDKEADAQKEREARMQRLRQTKATAVAARSASAHSPSQPHSSETALPAVPATARGKAPTITVMTKGTSVPSESSPLVRSPLPKKSKRPQQIVDDAEKDQSGQSLSMTPFENEDEAETHRKAELARQQLTTLGQFEPCWGWMLKSTGVLMSWQRRFFVMTRSGKIKYTAQDPTKEDNVKWVHVLNVEDITRVESDTFADSTVRPPADQYHSNSFYVDAVRSHRLPQHTDGAPKTQRFKFCCSNKADMNKWMWSLRNATDVVYTLEEGGLVQRSPLREHFRKMYAILSPLLCSSMQAARNGQRLTEGDEGQVSIELPTYRKRIQMEDDIAALEAQQREAAVKEKQRDEEEQRYHLLSPHTARSPSPPNPTLM